MNLHFITGNKNKFIEAQHLIPELTQLDIDVDEIQSNDPKIIITHKLEEASKQSDVNLFVEDTSVYFPALNMFPGPNIKWLMKDMGCENIAKLLQKYEDKTMIVKACVGLRYNHEIMFFEAEVKGECVLPQGEGHGFTPIFKPEGSEKTFAQMSKDEKSKISHRSQAIKQMIEYLEGR